MENINIQKEIEKIDEKIDSLRKERTEIKDKDREDIINKEIYSLVMEKQSLGYELLKENTKIIHDVYFKEFKRCVDELEYFFHHYEFYYFCESQYSLHVLMNSGIDVLIDNAEEEIKVENTFPYGKKTDKEYKVKAIPTALTVLRLNANTEVYSLTDMINSETGESFFSLYIKCAKYYTEKYREFHNTYRIAKHEDIKSEYEKTETTGLFTWLKKLFI